MDNPLSDFPRGDPNRTAAESKAPAASFANPNDVQISPALTYGPGKLFLGVAGAAVEGAGRDRYVIGGKAVGIADDAHACLIAGTRSGKGRSIIVPNMLQYTGSVLANDPKGELATITARQRSQGLGQKVHVLDPFGVAGGYAEHFRRGFNPFRAMRQGSEIEDAALIADALVIAGGGTQDPHWDESARSFIEGVILHLATAGPGRWVGSEGGPSLITLRETVGQGLPGPDGKRTMRVLELAMRENPGAHGVVQAAAADFFDRPLKERGSVLSSARRHLKFIDLFLERPKSRRTLESHEFDLTDLKREPTTIYLCLPGRYLGLCARWLRMFVNLALQAMEREGTVRDQLPVLFCLDEFAALGHMRQIEDAAGQMAGFGVKLWTILQDLGQLKALYKDRWETFLGNSGVIQFFGNNDLTTLEWISKRLGKTVVEATKTSELTSMQYRQGAANESKSLESYELLTVDEAARFFGRGDHMLRQLVLISGKRPVVLQRAYYDKHALFAGQFD